MRGIVLRAALVTSSIGSVLVAPSAAERQNPVSAVALQRIEIGGSDDRLVLRLIASGPVSGVLKQTPEPKRLYIDLPGVLPQVEPVTQIGRGGVRQIRTALFSTQPPITRVVLDVVGIGDYRLEQGPTANELRILVGPAAEVRPAASSASYLGWFNSVERRIEILLSATTRAATSRDGGLPLLAKEWARAQHDIESTKAPDRCVAAHSLLLETVRLARLGAERHAQDARLTAEAAGGETSARLLLARARAALPK